MVHFSDSITVTRIMNVDVIIPLFPVWNFNGFVVSGIKELRYSLSSTVSCAINDRAAPLSNTIFTLSTGSGPNWQTILLSLLSLICNGFETTLGTPQLPKTILLSSDVESFGDVSCILNTSAVVLVWVIVSNRTLLDTSTENPDFCFCHYFPSEVCH